MPVSGKDCLVKRQSANYRGPARNRARSRPAQQMSKFVQSAGKSLSLSLSSGFDLGILGPNVPCATVQL